MLATPMSLDEEHKELMHSLRESAELKDKTGKAVSEILSVLEPHFAKENDLVMPLLGSISDLVSGEKVQNLAEIAASQAPLIKEYDTMFKEHARIKKLVTKAQSLAKEEKHHDVIEILEALAHHARIEEEVLYPAALLAATVAESLLPKREITGVG